MYHITQVRDGRTVIVSTYTDPHPDGYSALDWAKRDCYTLNQAGMQASVTDFRLSPIYPN